MDTQNAIEKTATYVRETLEGEGSGHDWLHIQRVRATSLHICQAEGADAFVVELAALLHDIADWKFHNGDDTKGSVVARAWLESLAVDESIIEHVCSIIQHVSFKGAGVATAMDTLEGGVVQDADRLDAIGAIGIARAFAYGGHQGRLLYDPNTPPRLHQSFDEYKSDKGSTINHFHEKLLLLKDRMNTETAKQLALERHRYMEGFLDQFAKECAGEA